MSEKLQALSFPSRGFWPGAAYSVGALPSAHSLRAGSGDALRKGGGGGKNVSLDICSFTLADRVNSLQARRKHTLGAGPPLAELCGLTS